MKRYGLFLVALVGLCVAADDKDAAMKKEREKLAGTWKTVSMVRDGEAVDEEMAKQITVIHTADGKWTLQFAGNDAAEGTSKMDPTKKPKEIDYTYDDNGDKKTLKAIYELEGDSLKSCHCRGSDDKRPTEFESKPGSGYTYTVYKREKKK